MLCEIAHASVTRGGHEVLTNFSFSIKGTEKIAVVGRNGAGKSTLLSVIDGTCPVDRIDGHPEADVRFSRAVTIGSFSQITPPEDEGKTPDDFVREAAMVQHILQVNEYSPAADRLIDGGDDSGTAQGLEKDGCDDFGTAQGLEKDGCDDFDTAQGLEKDGCDDLGTVQGLEKDGCDDSDTAQGLEKDGCDDSGTAQGLEKDGCDDLGTAQGLEVSSYYASFVAKFMASFTRLGFALEDRNKKLSEFSGGERTKILLLRLFLTQPDILLLDEPTNHLDLQTVEWLEDQVRTYPKAVVCVSHDRYFIDRTADVVWEVSDGRLTKYSGNYSAYRQEKMKRQERLFREYQAQQDEIGRLEELIRRFKSKPRKAAFARSRARLLEKMDRIEKPKPDAARIHTEEIVPARRGSKNVLDCDKLVIGYDSAKPLRSVSFRLRRGQKIGIFGANGTGKSTFLKTLAGRLPALSGKLSVSETADIAYFDQMSAEVQYFDLADRAPTEVQYFDLADRVRGTMDAEGEGDAGAWLDASAGCVGEDVLSRDDAGTGCAGTKGNMQSQAVAKGLGTKGVRNSEKRVYDYFHDHFPALTGKEVRQTLAGYLFGPEDLGKKVSSLSGGERARLVLATLLQQKPNLLLLDEPTNNMDIPAKETLESIFRMYKGTIVFISHDRYFLSYVAEELLYFPPDSDKVLYIPFGYEHYKERQERAAANLAVARDAGLAVAMRTAEEQRMIEDLRAVPKGSRMQSREPSTAAMQIDWEFGLNRAERKPAEEEFEKASAEYLKVPETEEEFESRDEATLRAKLEEARDAWTKELLGWYDIWLESDGDYASEIQNSQ